LGARVSNRYGVGFDLADRPAQPSDWHPTAREKRCWRQRALGRNGPGRKRGAADGICRTIRRARIVGRGPQKAAGRKSFFLFLVIFTEYSFGDFVQILSNFHTVSSIQNNPTKFCLEKLKSNRNFSVKFKVNEFLNSCFRCK
jgi:hypothetical protein